MKLYSVHTVSMLAICLTAGLLLAGKKHDDKKPRDSRKKIVVTTTSDCGRGSLRRAIEKANELNCPEGAHIVFALETSDCRYNKKTKTWCITPKTDLPCISAENVSVDFLSQKGAKPSLKPTTYNSYKVELCGPGLEEGSAALTRGLCFTGNGGAAIGGIIRDWSVGIKSESDFNEFSQLLLKKNEKGITAGTESAVPLASFKGEVLTFEENVTGLEIKNTMSAPVNNTAFTNNQTAIHLPAPTVDIPIQEFKVMLGELLIEPTQLDPTSCNSPIGGCPNGIVSAVQLETSSPPA